MMASRTFTPYGKQQINVTSPKDPLIILLEITQEQLAVPVRVVNDEQDLVSNLNTFTSCGFEITLPDERDRSLPAAQVRIDNIGKELMEWVELSTGGRGATCRVMGVFRTEPDDLIFDLDLDLTSVSADNQYVTGILTYENRFNRPGIAKLYRSETAPGLV